MSAAALPFDPARIPRVDSVGIEERAGSLGKRSIKKTAKQRGIRLAVAMLDLTTLEGKDSEGKVGQLCQKAMHPMPGDPTVPHVAAVCVYPNLVRSPARPFREVASASPRSRLDSHPASLRSP